LKDIEVITIPFGETPLLDKLRYKIYGRDIEWAFYNPSFGKKIKNVINDFQPDVIHTHFGFSSWLFLKNFNDLAIPTFISFHGFDASHKLLSPRYCRTLRKFLDRPNTNAIFVSNFMRQNVEKAIGKVERSSILYYGTDTQFFTRNRPAPPKNPFIFLQISTFVPKKGHRYTVEAFAKLLEKHPNVAVKLILAGGGKLLEEIKNQCTTLNISDKVVFTGMVNPTQIHTLLQEAHAFVHHSVTPSFGDMEGIPNTLMEAMAMQLPILSTYHSGIPELVTHGVHGYLAQERDVETYAQQMYAILDWELKPENREKVELLFEKEKHCLILEEIYKRRA
jgi:glycosyltransferase involved in cell wall biosynthesis